MGPVALRLLCLVQTLDLLLPGAGGMLRLLWVPPLLALELLLPGFCDLHLHRAVLLGLLLILLQLFELPSADRSTLVKHLLLLAFALLACLLS